MEYPKMLYTGNKDEWSCRSAQNAEEEAQAREVGLVDYADLPEKEVEEVAPPIDPMSTVSFEQFDVVVKRLESAEAEIAQLKSTVQPEPFFPEIKYADSAEEVGEIVGDAIKPETIDYSTLITAQLQAILTEKGIEFKVRDSKAELLALLEAK